jgi:hypothetical protein
LLGELLSPPDLEGGSAVAGRPGGGGDGRSGEASGWARVGRAAGAHYRVRRRRRGWEGGSGGWRRAGATELGSGGGSGRGWCHTLKFPISECE